MGRKAARPPIPRLIPFAERIKAKVPEGENAAQYIHKKMNALGYSVSPPLPYDWISAYAEPTKSKHWIGLAKTLETSIDWLMTGEEKMKTRYLRIRGTVIQENGNPYFRAETSIVDKAESVEIERRRDSSIYLEIK
jgi:hypothetical protein